MRLALDRPQLISLAAGFTDEATLPVAEMRLLTREVLRDRATARQALQYGATPGLPALREQLGRRCAAQDNIEPVAPDDILITNGSQQLLYLVTEALCDPGDIVLVEDPTYFVYLGILEALGVQARGFAGVAGLEQRLAELQQRRQLSRLKLLYLVSYFRNPTGHTWSVAEKRAALSLLRRFERAAGHPLFLVEDAAYRDLRFAGDDVPSLLALDARRSRVVYVNTLTKPFATGLKVGYGVLPPLLRRSVLRSKGNHDFGTANFLQVILARALATGLYQRHLPVIAAAYRHKRDVMVQALRTYFPASTRFTEPEGGLYVWAELQPPRPTGPRSALFRRALAAGVFYVPGELCYCADPTRPVPVNALRLSFGAATAAEIKKGIRRLADSLG